MKRGNRTILVVDNDPALVSALTLRLEANGYSCVVARSGTEGFAQFQRLSVDLVLSDLNMPHGDGVALAESIRRVSQVPIVLVSGHKEEFRRRLRGIPDVTFLRKPFLPQELLEVVAAALECVPARAH